MMQYDLLIRNVQLYDGTGGEPARGDLAIKDGRIARIGDFSGVRAETEIDGQGRALAPGFIDVHTHDDTNVVRTPDMMPKISQGVTTVVTGNCGISAAPVRLAGDPPDPMNLLGEKD